MRIYVHSGEQQDPEAVELAPDAVLGDALALGADEILLLEETDDALDPSGTPEAAGIADRAHLFRGRRHPIAVAVDFNGEQRGDTFGAATRVERALHWAVGKHGFNLSKQDATEHVLALPDGTVPAEDAHLGSLPGAAEGALTFDLVPKHRFEG